MSEQPSRSRVRWTIAQAITPEQIDVVRYLLRTYADALPFDLCFQRFEEELSALPGPYAAPLGRLLLAVRGGQPAGCVAIRPVDAATAEMKRLFVVDAFRGAGLGTALAARVLADASDIGYHYVVLDTVEPLMPAAVRLYRSLGFEPIEPYNANPLDGALHMRIALPRSLG